MSRSLPFERSPSRRSTWIAISTWFFCVAGTFLGLSHSSLAGCGTHGSPAAMQAAESPRHAGELGLAMYVQYVGGSITYSLTPPAAPCEGPQCGSHPSWKPIGALVFPLRTLIASPGIESDEDGSAPDCDPQHHRRADSEFALRGLLSVLEHPPRCS